MRGLWAALRKDLRLFRSGAGLLSLLLPALLLLALQAGMGDTLGRAYLRPFPIAVRDSDGTVMSRSLIAQMEEVDLFSHVVLAGEETDAQLLSRGCAAVVTIPRDFFYAMYRMDNSLVEVTLNQDMPLEAALFRSVFTSVMGIISSDQAVGRAVYRFCYGDLSYELERQMWEETSRTLLTDALSRQSLIGSISDPAQLQDSLSQRLLACTLTVLCLFFPLSVVKSLPGELASGVLPRFLAAGGSRGAFFLSKLLTALLLALPSLLLVLPVLGRGDPAGVGLLALLLFLVGFSLMLFLSAWAGETAAAQRWGNLLLLLSLVLGGALYPIQLLPAPARLFGGLTLPYWAIRGLELLRQEAPLSSLFTALAPAWVLGGAALLLAFPPLLRVRPTGRTRALPAPTQPPPASPSRRRGRLLSLSLAKLSAMSGRFAGLAALLLVCLICGFLSASAVSAQAPESLGLSLCIPPEDAQAQLLQRVLEGREGLTVLPVSSPQAGQALLSAGRAEGFLLVEEGYADALSRDGDLPLHYESAAGASSALAAREIIAGAVSAQRARLRGLTRASQLLGRPLTPREEALLLDEMDAQEVDLGPLYAVSGSRGAPPSLDGLFTPSLLGFAALCIFLTLLTWSVWTTAPDVHRVAGRLAVLPGGRALSYGSDLLALFLVGALSGALVLLPGGPADPLTWCSLAALVFSLAALSLLLTGLPAASGKADSLAPFVALITSLLGGCFGDLGNLDPALRTLSLCTPQGLALSAASGSLPALGLLLLGGLLALLAGYLLSRRATC